MRPHGQSDPAFLVTLPRVTCNNLPQASLSMGSAGCLITVVSAAGTTTGNIRVRSSRRNDPTDEPSGCGYGSAMHVCLRTEGDSRTADIVPETVKIDDRYTHRDCAAFTVSRFACGSESVPTAFRTYTTHYEGSPLTSDSGEFEDILRKAKFWTAHKHNSPRASRQ